MGVIGRLMWVNTSSKKQCKSLFWRMRAAMKKAIKKQTILVALYGGSKKAFNFHYDPSSYALNFDDGTFHHHEYHHHHVVEQHKFTKLPLSKQQGSHPADTTRVYVIWVGSF
ncbi:hypothetical protein HanRHA438_Chr04g0196491 [Helianthus annuus]|nr:hypothetical protein HanIR_Chr04g0201201 [Helianthus annuus]KAJ0928655.1 hypothetical protein HanRHA438_Chr04g0196491 [Helianthus annuus]